jgi:mono/diheme cytochrome c family protein
MTRHPEHVVRGISIALILASGGAFAQDPKAVAKGAELYATHCAPCHGPHMKDPEGAADLRKFPRDARERFTTSVTRGKNQMPPWGDLLKPEEIDALWAYVVAGEKE